jgi:putative spermidine/putrescine transport system permease protein
MVGHYPRWVRVGAGLLVVFVLIYMLVPLAVVVGAAFSESRFLSFPPQGFSTRWFAEVFESSKFVEPFVTSLQIASITAILAAVIGTTTALAVTRGTLPGAGVIQSLALSPLVIPGIIFAIGLLSLASTVLGGVSLPVLVLAHVVIAVPYVVRTVIGVLQRTDRFTEEAARVMGARWWRRYWHVLLPVCRPGIVAGAFFAFIASFDDAVIALFIRTPTLRTLPVAIYSELEFSADPTVAAVSTVSMAVTIVLIALIEKTIGIGRAFGTDG